MEEEKLVAMSQDHLLGQRLSLYQRQDGHRFGIDAVLLAAGVSAYQGDKVLEVGCGVGAALFCLGTRVPGLWLTGVERESSLVTLARKNAFKNGFGDTSSLLQGDIFDKSLDLEPQSFDHVMTNPPFIEGNQTLSQSALKARAYHADEGKCLKDWVRACLKYTKPRGTFSLIHRADHLDKLIQGLTGRVGDLKILPLASKQGRAPKRVIVTGRKGVNNPCTLLFPLLVHEQDGTYTDQAREILEKGQGLFDGSLS